MVLGQEVARLNKVVQQVLKVIRQPILIPSAKVPGLLNAR